MIRTRTIKICIVIFMAIFFVLGIVLIGVGGGCSNVLGTYAALSPSVRYTSAPELLGVAGCLIMTVVICLYLCGCWESPNTNRCGFICAAVLFLVALGLEISGTTVAYKDREKISDTLSDDVIKTIRKLYGIEEDPSSAIDALQEKGECCGWYNYTDWRESRFAREVTVLNDSVVPDSCCVKGPRERFHCGRHFSVNNIYTKGCQGVFLYKLIRDRLYSTAVTGINAIVFQIPGILFLAFIICRKKPEFSSLNEEDTLIFRSGFWRECFKDD